MIENTDIGNKLLGFYRGQVILHLTHGYCKIYIPSVYPKEWKDNPALLPPAELAASLFAGTNNGSGVFTYPNISSMVWCFFANNDQNYPIYFASSLGGENAFGQHATITDVISGEYEDKDGNKQVSSEISCSRHMITSGKTHIEWYENGKLSVLVEDPDRRDAIIDYSNNTYIGMISDDSVSARPICEKVNAEELSNIHCKIVLDNDLSVYGSISALTHRFDIISGDDSHMLLTNDNDLVLDNTGRMNLEMLSVYDYLSNGTTESLKSHNNLSIVVPGNTYFENSCISAIEVQGLLTSNMSALNQTLRSVEGYHTNVIGNTYELTSISADKQLIQLKDCQKLFEINVPGDMNLRSTFTNDLTTTTPAVISSNLLSTENSITLKNAEQYERILNKTNNITYASDPEKYTDFLTCENEYSVDISGNINEDNMLIRNFISDKRGIDSLSSNVHSDSSTAGNTNHEISYDNIKIGTDGSTEITSANIADGRAITDGYTSSMKYSYTHLIGNNIQKAVNNSSMLDCVANADTNVKYSLKLSNDIIESLKQRILMYASNEIDLTNATSEFKFLNNLATKLISAYNKVDVNAATVERRIENNFPSKLIVSYDKVDADAATVERRIENNLPSKLIVSYDKVDANASIHEIKMTDQTTSNESAININTSSGEITIHMKNGANNSTIVLKNDGTATLTTTNKLDVQTTNSVNVNTTDINFNGSLSITMTAPTISMTGTDVNIESSSVKVDGGSINVSGGSVDITGSSGDCDIAGISLISHIHPVPAHCPSDGMTLIPFL